MFRIFYILLVLSAWNEAYAHNSKAASSEPTDFQEKLKAYNATYGSDALLHIMFGNASAAQFPAKFFPQIQSLSDPYDRKFQTTFENEMSTFLQVIQMGDPWSIDLVIQKADSSTSKEWKQSPYSQFLQRTKNSRQLKKDLDKIGGPSPLTQSIVYGFDQLPMGNLVEEPIGDESPEDFKKSWAKKSSWQRYVFLSNLEDYIFYKAMFNIQQQSAFVAMFLNQDPDRATWKKNVVIELQKQFCSFAPKSNDPSKVTRDKILPDINLQFKRRCYWMAEMAVDSIREWMTIDTALNQISKSLEITDGHLSELRAHVMKHGSVTEDFAGYLQYVSSYSIASGTPAGKAILVSPMANEIHLLFSLDQINTQAWDVSHIIPYYNQGDPMQDQKWVDLFKKSMKNLSSSLNKSYVHLTEIYKKNPQNKLQVDPSFLVQYLQSGIREMIQYYPKAVGQVISDRPELRWYLLDATKAIEKNQKTKETLHQVATFGMIAIGMLLMTFGVGEVLMAKGIISLTISSKVAAIVGLVELGLAIGDVGISVTYKAIKRTEYQTAKASLIAGNTNDVLGTRKLFTQLEEANVSRAWAVGGAIFQIPQMYRAYKIFKATGSVSEALSGASMLSKHVETKPNITPQPTSNAPLASSGQLSLSTNKSKAISNSYPHDFLFKGFYVNDSGQLIFGAHPNSLAAPFRPQSIFIGNPISSRKSLRIIKNSQLRHQNDEVIVLVTTLEETSENYLTIANRSKVEGLGEPNLNLSADDVEIYPVLDHFEPMNSNPNGFLIQNNQKLYRVKTWPEYPVEIDEMPFITPEFSMGVRWSKYEDTLIKWISTPNYTFAICDDGTWMGILEREKFDNYRIYHLPKAGTGSSEKMVKGLIEFSEVIRGRGVQGLSDIDFVNSINKSKRISIHKAFEGVYVDLDEATYLIHKDGAAIEGKPDKGKIHKYTYGEIVYTRDFVAWSLPEHYPYRDIGVKFKILKKDKVSTSFVLPRFGQDFPNSSVDSELKSPLLNVWYMDHWLNGGGDNFFLMKNITKKIEVDDKGKLLELPFEADEIFNFYAIPQVKPTSIPKEALEKLNKLPDLGTAIVKIEPTQKPFVLTYINVRKEKGKLVFYNMEKSEVTDNSDFYFPEIDDSDVSIVKNNYEVYVTTTFHETIDTKKIYEEYWKIFGLVNSIERIQ